MSSRGHHGLLLVSAAGPIDPSFSSVSSLLPFDGSDASTTIVDVKGHPWTASGSAQLDTAQSKFGGSSLLLNGSTSYITMTDGSSADFQFGTGDLTIETWMYLPSAGNGNWRNFFDQRSAGLGLTMRVNTAQKINFFRGDGGNDTTGAITIPNDQFVHVALTRSGDVFRTFIAGVKDTENTYAINLDKTSGKDTTIGRSAGDNSHHFNGWLDDYRITKGVARYTANFTPPTAAFPHS